MNGMTLFLVFAGALATAYILGITWIIQRAHKTRMELAALGARLISQDSLLPRDEQLVVAWMLRRAYSPAPMLAVTAALPLSVWEVLFRPSEVARDKGLTAYGRFRQRPEGEKFTRLFALSIMAANIPMALIFGLLNGVFAPFLTVRGGTGPATERAVDHAVDLKHTDNALAA